MKKYLVVMESPCIVSERSSAFASSEITCRYDGIPNRSWPDRIPDPSDVFKLTNLVETSKVTIEQETVSGETCSNVLYRMDSGGSSDWVAFKNKPGVCWIADRS